MKTGALDEPRRMKIHLQGWEVVGESIRSRCLQNIYRVSACLNTLTISRAFTTYMNKYSSRASASTVRGSASQSLVAHRGRWVLQHTKHPPFRSVGGVPFVRLLLSREIKLVMRRMFVIQTKISCGWGVSCQFMQEASLNLQTMTGGPSKGDLDTLVSRFLPINMWWMPKFLTSLERHLSV